MRTDRLQRDFGAALRWSVFPLHPEIPEEGMDLAELFVGREEQLGAMQARLLQLSIEEGLPLAERFSPGSTTFWWADSRIRSKL